MVCHALPLSRSIAPHPELLTPHCQLFSQMAHFVSVLQTATFLIPLSCTKSVSFKRWINIIDTAFLNQSLIALHGQTAVGCWCDSVMDTMILWSLSSPIKMHWKACIGWSYLLFVMAELFIYNKASLMRSCVNTTVTDKDFEWQPVGLQWLPF